jgi:hypothetical protein
MSNSRFVEIEFELLALYYLNVYYGGIDKIKKIFYDYKLNEVRRISI